MLDLSRSLQSIALHREEMSARSGNPQPEPISTAYVERQNLSIRRGSAASRG
jgi:hypothetical protein